MQFAAALGHIWPAAENGSALALCSILTTTEEDYTMTLRYPFHDVAIFEPNNSHKIMYAYPVAKNSCDTFLMLLNYWIKMETDYVELNSKYDY
jgi:hypothetical protein